MASGFTAPKLPVYLAPGYASIYGAASIYGISSDNEKLVFGTINQLFFPGAFTEGQSVMFNLDEALVLKRGGMPYFLIHENKIILTEKDL